MEGTFTLKWEASLGGGCPMGAFDLMGCPKKSLSGVMHHSSHDLGDR